MSDDGSTPVLDVPLLGVPDVPPKQPPQQPRITVKGFGAIYLRGSTWYLDYWKDGKQHRESSKSGKERVAIALLKQRHGEIARGELITPKADKLTVSELLDGVIQDYELSGNRSIKDIRHRIAPLKERFGHERASRLREQQIENYRTDRLAIKKARATINRELEALKRGYRLAVEKKQISPVRVPIIRFFPENNARQGFVEYEEFCGIVQHLPEPIADIAWFAYLSGWRKAEVLSLTWDDVDRANGVVTLRPEFSKNKEPRELPLANPGLQGIIERRWNARLVMTENGPLVVDRLFHRDGKPVKVLRRCWASACKKVGRPDLLFHDLRRSAVRNMVKAGVREKVAMRITGHKTRSMFDRYHIVDDRDVREALKATEAAFAADQHKSGIYQHNQPQGTV